jgi:flavin reductase (DIM6/NTAB) family NADH-FMN oxidoreductase RutF
MRDIINFQEFTLKSITAWDDDWFLLSAGDFLQGKHNSMTISWGSIGVIWGKPFTQVVVRPTRYTHEFIEQFPDFTICAFDENYRKALNVMGSKSGRKIDKVKASKLTPISSKVVSAPSFEEARLIIECKTMYKAPFDPKAFINPDIEKCYTASDYHTSYYGEILHIEGDRNLYATLA